MLTTQQVRDAWGPPCQGQRTTVALFGAGTVSVRSQIVAAVQALDQCLRAAEYATRKADTGAYNCRKITGGTGYSLHAYGVALDINWQSNPYGKTLVTDMPVAMREAIKAIRTINGKQVWRWGGDYSGNKDAMHYEIVCTPADLATGIVGAPPAPPATGTPQGSIGSRLGSGQFLAHGQSLTNDRWSLHHQADGNVVIYEGPPTAANARWSTGTAGDTTRSLDMQTDGNLCLNRDGAGPVWVSDTPGNPGSYVELQADGNLVLHAADGAVLWDRVHGKVHRPAQGVPPFPLASGHWFGVTSPDPHNHSGYWESDRPLIARMVDRLRARGWRLTAGDRYTTDVEKVVRAFQVDKHLAADGRVGATTWTAIWGSPIT